MNLTTPLLCVALVAFLPLLLVGVVLALPGLLVASVLFCEDTEPHKGRS